MSTVLASPVVRADARERGTRSAPRASPAGSTTSADMIAISAIALTARIASFRPADACDRNTLAAMTPAIVAVAEVMMLMVA